MSGVKPVRIGSIVIHCFEFRRMLDFWSAALGYAPKYPPTDDWVILADPDGGTPNLSLQARDRRAVGRSWFHLDLYAIDQAAEVERLVGLGARRYPWRYDPHADYVVLEDPDGNLFCVVDAGEAARP